MNQPHNHWAAVVQTAVQAIGQAEPLVQQLLAETANRIAAAVATPEMDPSVGHQAFILIERNRQKWQQVFPVYLLEACAEVEPFDLYASTTGGALNLNSLFLCSELAIQVRSEVAHQLRTLESALAQPLNTLNGLISGARGYAEVRTAATPMRPENYVVALQKMVYASTTERAGAVGDAKVSLYLLKELIAGLAPLLAPSYQMAILVLSDAHVQAVTKRASGFGTLSTRTMPSEWLTANEATPALLTREVLQQALKHRQAAGPLSATAPPTPKAALRQEQAHAPGPSFSQIIAQLGRACAGAPLLKERAARLVPGLRALAQNDPSFLQNPAHPARQLIAKVEALAAQPEGADPQAVAALSQYAQGKAAQAPLAHTPTARFLKQAIKAFEAPAAAPAGPCASPVHPSSGGPHERPPPAAHAPAAVAPVKAQPAAVPAKPAPLLSATEYGEQIRQWIAHLPGFDRAPQRLQTFMCGPWLMLIVKTYYKRFVAQLECASSAPPVHTFDPQGYLRLLSPLIASVQPDALHQPSAQDQQALQACWDRIAHGLVRMRLAPHKVQAAIEKLQIMHKAACEQAVVRPPPAPAKAGDLPREMPVDTRAAPPPERAPTRPPVAPVATDELAPLEQILDLQKQFLIGPSEQSVQSTLVWMSSDCTIFMFSSQNGSSQTMTRRRLQQLYTARSFRPIL